MEKVFNHTAHRELWDWLAKNPDKSKNDWPGWAWNDGAHEDASDHQCFACDYDMDCAYRAGEPNNCPLEWPNSLSCYSDERLFHNWEAATKEERPTLAAQIRDLPVKSGTKTI